MSTSSNNNLAALQSATYNNTDTTTTKTNKTETDDTSAQNTAAETSSSNKVGTVAESKQQFNSSIVEAALSVSISSGNDSLSLLYKTAIENINEALQPELGDNAIQASAANNDDNSPEGTATRILSFISSLYELYRSQKVESGEEFEEADLAAKFVGIVGGGVDKGFNEAKTILTGLGVFNGDIEANANKTYELVQKGLQLFIDTKKPKDDSTDTDTKTETATNTDASANNTTGNTNINDTNKTI